MPAFLLAGPCRFELGVRKSRFLCQAQRAESLEAALAFVEQASDAGASHNCWAYRIGNQCRFSDDGEPAGTAGRPILTAIGGRKLDQTVTLVTRWFGGNKLGAGGLARAYGGCTAECLRRADKLPIIETCEVLLRAAFPDIGIAHKLLDECGVEKLDEQFSADGVSIRLRVPSDQYNRLDAALRDGSHGRADLLRLNVKEEIK